LTDGCTAGATGGFDDCFVGTVCVAMMDPIGDRL